MLFIGGDCDDVIRDIVVRTDWKDDFEQVLPERHNNFMQTT